MAIREHEIVPFDRRDVEPEAHVELPRTREQYFELEMRSGSVGNATLVRCASPIGKVDLRDRLIVDEFYELQRELGVARLCARLGDHHESTMSIERDLLLHLEATQVEEVIDLIRKTVLEADRMEELILEIDSG